MSLVRVAVDVTQLVLNRWPTAPHKATQEGRFKMKGENIFGECRTCVALCSSLMSHALT